MFDIPFGQLAKQLRRDCDFTQEDFAEQVGCSVETIGKIERGERRPSKQVAERMALVLELAPEDRAAFIRAARLQPPGNLGKLIEEPGGKQPRRPADKERAAQPISLPAGLLVPSPPAPRGPAPLPAPPTPFVGREAELAELTTLLADPACRLLTITGPGGIGKTRLALEAAAGRNTVFAHGVAFVPLAAIATPELLAPAIADALGFTFYGPADFAGQLLGYLHDRSPLLLLDNIEHLIDAGGATWELLAAIGRQAPGVKLLVTSRERLNLQGEWVVELRGLPLPGEGDAVFEDSSAVALFLQTARRTQSGFALADEDRACVAHICRLVEGMPLAIELAAAWVRVLPCAEIAAEIERTLDFLAASARDIPARHRSLRAVFDHSWNLLSAEERAAFSTLAVFRGGFRREAAEWVAGATLHQLTALADKSLLRRSKAGRYDMHELVRQYAAAHLEADPAAYAAARDRHCGYYTTLLQRREKDMKRALQKAVLSELVAEIDNLRAAWDWALERRRIDEIRLSLRGLSWFYEIRSWFQEGEAMFRRAAEAIGQPQNREQRTENKEQRDLHEPRTGTRRVNREPLLYGGPSVAAEAEQLATLGHLLAHQGWFCLRQGRHSQARAVLQRSLALLRPLDDRIALADTLTSLGTATRVMGESGAARDILREGLALGRALDDDWVLVICLGGLAMAAHDLGEHPEAERLAREGLALARRSANPRGVVFAISTFSLAVAAQGRHAEAQELLRESLELSSAAGDYWGIGSAFNQIGMAAKAQGAYATAQYCFRESVAMFREIGDHWNVARTLISLGEASLAKGDRAEARRAFGDAWRMANDTQTAPAVLEALLGLADLAAHEGAAGVALELCAYVLVHPLSTYDARERAGRLRAALEPVSASAPAPDRPIEAAVAEVLGEHSRSYSS
ncbi:MAG: tetratricopeptide repeat protein [Roseiflexaceae bacterium]